LVEVERIGRIGKDMEDVTPHEVERLSAVGGVANPHAAGPDFVVVFGIDLAAAEVPADPG